MKEFLGKKYKLSASEKFDDFMKAVGVSLLTRTVANNTSPTVMLTENDGMYKLTTISTFKNQTIEFKLGEEFDEKTLDDRNVKSVITMKDNKLIHAQDSNKIMIEREFKPDEMVAVMKIDDIVCTRVYKLVE